MWEQYPEVLNKIKQIDEIILGNLKSRSKPLEAILHDLPVYGGKKLRPALTILAAGFGKVWEDKILDTAAGIEILHMATLVHDDMIDNADIRRGEPTINRQHGDKMAVYMGDYLLTRAVMLLSKALPEDRLERIARGIKSVCEAEVEQFYSRFNLDISVVTYLKRISRKTSALFAFSCSEGAFLSKCREEHLRSLAKFGYYFGMAFQVKDDILNLTEETEKTGKPEGNDIKEGVITLPFILALRKSSDFTNEAKRIFSSGEMSRENVRQIICEIINLGGVRDAGGWIERYIDKARAQLNALPDIRAREILWEITEYIISYKETICRY